MKQFARAMTRGLYAVAFSLWCIGAVLAQSAPQPLLNANTPVDWWFVFKFNAATGPGCTGQKTPACIFGGKPGKYADYDGTVQWGQHFAVASSANPTLSAPASPPGNTCVGDSVDDPVGATYSQIYNSASYFYVVWNDQFYASPIPNRDSPWGHSKGIVAWDKNGDGVVMQVSTPSWPASGNKKFPRKKDGNTLGCVNDDDVEVSQHFFALKLNKDDLVQVLKALANASVATDAKNGQIFKNGGPQEVQNAVKNLGVLSNSATATSVTLSTGVRLISKPSNLLVPPWQMVSALLKSPSANAGPALKAATWWMDPEIPPTTTAAKPGCWDAALATPGPVAIAVTGTWDGKPIGLTGGNATTKNHAKIGVSEDGGATFSIFGDMNQQGVLAPRKTKSSPKGTCDSSQDGRGGTFYVLDNPKLFESMTNLLKGQTAPP
jgi:hypothetical protein